MNRGLNGFGDYAVQFIDWAVDEALNKVCKDLAGNSIELKRCLGGVKRGTNEQIIFSNIVADINDKPVQLCWK